MLSKKIVATFLFGTFAITPIASVAGSSANASPKVSAAGPDAMMVASSAMARQLAAYGDANKDPAALVMAAKIIKGTPSQEVARQKQSKGKATAVGSKAEKADPYSVDALLERAKQMSGQRPDILAMAQEVGGMATRGRVGGPSSTRERVNSNSTDTYSIKFRGDERAAIYVEGDGDTDLDLYVYDENNNEICSDTDRTDVMLCEWTPSWTGTFHVRIKNLGSVYNRYVLRTN